MSGRVRDGVAAWLTVALACGAGGVGPATAQEQAMGERESRYDNALASAAEAMELLQRDGLEAAVPVLESTLESCGRGPNGEGCRRVALYALGYAHQTSAAGRPGDRDVLLRRAVGYFQEVRRENPEFAPAAEALALAYRQMGAQEWQEADLRRLAEDDDSGRYTLLLGDYYRDREMPERARDRYLRAMELAPSDPEPRSRLLALYRDGSLPAAELVPALREWEIRFPEVAAEGYVVAMHRLYPKSWSDAAEVLPHWLSTQRSLDQLGPGLVKRSPRTGAPSRSPGSGPSSSIRWTPARPTGGSPPRSGGRRWPTWPGRWGTGGWPATTPGAPRRRGSWDATSRPRGPRPGSRSRRTSPSSWTPRRA